MHIQVRARNAAIKLRDILIPACPTVSHKGKPHKVLPVCFISNEDPNQPVVIYSLPPQSKDIGIPRFIDDIPIQSKAWEGPAPKDIQKLAMKAFAARKK